MHPSAARAADLTKTGRSRKGPAGSLFGGGFPARSADAITDATSMSQVTPGGAVDKLRSA